MANTKNIADRSERKTAKRAQRKALKGVFSALSDKQRKRFRKSETEGLRAWVAEQKSAE
jgi:hypothetical protein